VVVVVVVAGVGYEAWPLPGFVVVLSEILFLDVALTWMLCSANMTFPVGLMVSVRYSVSRPIDFSCEKC
jgi:hypothetical protein